MDFAGIRTYPVLNNEIVGGPAWMDSDRFNVEAKPQGNPAGISTQEWQSMVQTLLVDRFGLKAHLENRDMPVYDLVTGRNGLKIKRSIDQTPPPAPGSIPFDPYVDLPSRGSSAMYPDPSGVILAGTSVPISKLATMLQAQTDRRVIDKTKLSGLFDFKLQFLPESHFSPFGGANPSGLSTMPDGAFPALFTAIQEQLGLKLANSKGLVEVLVISNVQHPTED